MKINAINSNWCKILFIDNVSNIKFYIVANIQFILNIGYKMHFHIFQVSSVVNSG